MTPSNQYQLSGTRCRCPGSEVLVTIVFGTAPEARHTQNWLCCRVNQRIRGSGWASIRKQTVRAVFRKNQGTKWRAPAVCQVLARERGSTEVYKVPSGLDRWHTAFQKPGLRG